ncbi:MAG: deoxyuridine 5'-triphosphate nucleotidohydrolase [Ignisphaera sp.]|uniref:Deoxyuridine 5'-triphosphate nucleotidohydrolase n=1 Tax=Ignisphaera aggregans TaxID=334771 RepID=A0A7C4NJ23_9CREN
MVVLSPETLIQLLNVSKDQLDCSGLKLHLDKVFSLVSQGSIYKSTKKLSEVIEVKSNDNGIYTLTPGAYRIRYKEIVKVPENAMALAIPRSTLLRIGATIFTAVWDPGYEGRGEGLMVVFNPYGVEVEQGAQIAQLVFISLDKVTNFVYRGTYFKENI